MKFTKFINQIFDRFGLAVIRKGTLDRLTTPHPAVQWPDELARALKDLQDATALGHQRLLRHQISTKWDIIDTLESDRKPAAELSCPLCGCHSEAEKFDVLVSACIFGGGELTRHQCPQCDLVFGPEKMLRLSEAALSRDYEWHYQVFSEGDSTAQEVRAFHALTPNRDGVYLNWGAGAWSKSVDVLRQDGWNVYAYEPHGSASASGPYLITNKEQLSAMRFDGIFSNNVLEHLRYPIQALSTMRDLLKPGGKMSHATPCFEYLYEFTRFHLFFFPGRSRAILADKAGLRVESFVSDGEFMNLLLAAEAE